MGILSIKSASASACSAKLERQGRPEEDFRDTAAVVGFGAGWQQLSGGGPRATPPERRRECPAIGTRARVNSGGSSPPFVMIRLLPPRRTGSSPAPTGRTTPQNPSPH